MPLPSLSTRHSDKAFPAGSSIEFSAQRKHQATLALLFSASIPQARYMKGSAHTGLSSDREVPQQEVPAPTAYTHCLPWFRSPPATGCQHPTSASSTLAASSSSPPSSSPPANGFSHCPHQNLASRAGASEQPLCHSLDSMV